MNPHLYRLPSKKLILSHPFKWISRTVPLFSSLRSMTTATAQGSLVREGVRSFRVTREGEAETPTAYPNHHSFIPMYALLLFTMRLCLTPGNSTKRHDGHHSDRYILQQQRVE
ncbi:hypothetical protein Baya_8030 [Bagarius yarrelli]|uniref:Uncharacterized protein n=1 Tax=Bagarius yarrelli TaxID=175774 RepID=A0A556U433_BAGYA|nr:hypothetical protein Baya_8030 [Bagarius yarrelli]